MNACSTTTTTKTVTLVRKDNLTQCIREFLEMNLKAKKLPSIEEVIEHVGGQKVWKSYTASYRSTLRSSLTSLKWKRDKLLSLENKYADICKRAAIRTEVKVNVHTFSNTWVDVVLNLTGYVKDDEGGEWVTTETITEYISDLKKETISCRQESEVLKALDTLLPGGEKVCQKEVSTVKGEINNLHRQLRMLEKKQIVLASNRRALKKLNKEQM